MRWKQIKTSDPQFALTRKGNRERAEELRRHCFHCKVLFECKIPFSTRFSPPADTLASRGRHSYNSRKKARYLARSAAFLHGGPTERNDNKCWSIETDVICWVLPERHVGCCFQFKTLVVVVCGGDSAI